MKTNKPKFHYFIFLLFIFACTSTKKIKTEGVQTLPDLPNSEIDIPIKIAAQRLLAKAEQLVPLEFTSNAWPEYNYASCDFRYKYRFIRTPLQITAVNNIVTLRFSGNYQISGGKCLCTAGIPVTPWISGSCGFNPQPLRKVNMTLSSTIEYLSNYSVRTTTTINQVQAVDKCTVSVFSNDITQLVMDSIRASLVSFSSAMDKNLAGQDFGKLISNLIDSSYHKISIGKYGYFLLNPSAFRIGQLNYKKDSFEISVGSSIRPQLGSDSVNHIEAPKVLPALLQTETRKGMRLYVNMQYDYVFLNHILHDSLYNKIFDIKGRTIVAKDAIIRGLDSHQIELRVDFVGSNHGSIILRGTPTLDTAKQTLSIPDIQYSMEGEDLALKIAKSLFKNKIRNTIQGKSYLDIKAVLNSNKPAIDQMFNRELTKGFYSSGKINEARILAMLITEQGIQFQVFISGDVEIFGGNL
jgi:hypothetical protein